MSEWVRTKTTTYDDGDWIRRAIVVPKKGATFNLVTEDGEFVALINAFVYFDEEGNHYHSIIDVIDPDEMFPEKFALVFNDGVREFHKANGNLVCADFRRSSNGNS